MGNFNFRSIAPKLFFGYDLIKNKKHYTKIASIEKAILDYFYFHSHLQSITDFSSLRINQEVMIEQVNENKLFEYLKEINQKRLNERINNFWRYIKDVI